MREAILACRSAGIVSIIQGAGKPATQLMYEGHPWRDTTFTGYAYNLQKAKELLTQAGVDLPQLCGCGTDSRRHACDHLDHPRGHLDSHL